jgi:hypothetical protein
VLNIKLNKISTLIVICFSLFNLIACSPKTHLIGLGMRKFNLSQNKYSKKNPYIKIPESKKKNLKQLDKIN